MKRIVSLFMSAMLFMTQVSAAPSFVTDDKPVTVIQSEEDTSRPEPDYFYDFEANSDDWVRENDFFTFSDGGLVSKKDFVSQAWLSYEEWENFDLEFDFTVMELPTEHGHWFAPIIRGTNYMIIPSGGMQYNSPETGVQNGPSLPESIEVGQTWTMRIEAEEKKGTVYIKKTGKGTFEKVGVMPISQTKGKLGFISFPAVVKVDNVKIWDTTDRPFEFENRVNTIAVGETKTLSIINTSGEALTFKSENPDIVTVDTGGKITAVKTGKAKLTATGEGGYTTSTVVNAVKYITGIALPTMERELYIGESINFKLNIHPTDATEKILEWTSSDENVIQVVGATYNMRGIKAVGEGTAELIIKTPDGSAEGSCVFTVTKRPPLETGETVFAMKGISHEIPKDKFGVTYMSTMQAYQYQWPYTMFEEQVTKQMSVIKEIGFAHIANAFSHYDFKQGISVNNTNVTENTPRYYIKEHAADIFYDTTPAVVWQMQANHTEVGGEYRNLEYTLDLIKEIKSLNPDKPLYISCGPEAYAMNHTDSIPRVEDYIEFFKALSNRVKSEIDPEAKFSVTLMGPRMYRAIISDPNNWARWDGDWEYTQGTRATTWHTALAEDQSWFDAIDLHPYITAITDVNVTGDEFMHEISRVADYNTRTGLNEVARLFPDKEIWNTEWSDFELQYSYSADVDKGRAQQQKTVGSTIAVMQMLGEHMNDERTTISSFHDAWDPQGFGLVEGTIEDRVELPYYYAFKKVSELFGVNGRSTHAYPLGMIAGETVQDTIALNQDNAFLNTQEVYAYGFGDEENIKDVYFTNPTYKSIRVKLSDALLRKDWEFVPKKADEPFPDFYTREIGWLDYDPSTIELPKTYENGEFSEYIELPPYSIVFASVDASASFVEVPENAKDALVLKTTSNKAIMPDGYLRYIDTDNPEIKPIIAEDRALVPLRIAAECFDAYTIWNGSESSIGVEGTRYRVDMKIGSNELVRDVVLFREGDEEVFKLDVAPQILQGRTMVPLRALSEAMGNKVLWDQETGLIVISENEIELTRDELNSLSGILD